MMSTPECHICLEELRTDLSAVPCGHVFHDECLRHALRVQSSCPICRRHIVSREVVGLFLEIPTAAIATNSPHSSAQHAKPTDQARIDVLKQRIQWYKQQTEQLCDRFKQQQQQASQCVHEKQQLLIRIKQMERTQKNLQNQLAHYEFQIRSHAKEKEEYQLNSSIAKFLENCQCEVLEEELRDPRDLIMALKKANKFRHEQYQRLVKEKAALKEALQTTKCSNQYAKRKRLATSDKKSMNGKRVRCGGLGINTKISTSVQQNGSSESQSGHNAELEHGEIDEPAFRSNLFSSRVGCRGYPRELSQSRTHVGKSLNPARIGAFALGSHSERTPNVNDLAHGSSSHGENDSHDDEGNSIRIQDQNVKRLSVAMRQPQLTRLNYGCGNGSFRSLSSTGSHGTFGGFDRGQWNSSSVHIGLGPNINLLNREERIAGSRGLRSRSMQQLLQPFPSLDPVSSTRRRDFDYCTTPLTRWLGQDS